MGSRRERVVRVGRGGAGRGRGGRCLTLDCLTVCVVRRQVAPVAKAWREFNAEDPSGHGVPSMFSLDGQAHRKLDTRSLDDASQAYLSANMRTVDPLYGLLRPMDRLQAHRLEISTKNVFTSHPRTLREHWRDAVTAALGDDLALRPPEQRVLVNLAANDCMDFVDVGVLGERLGSGFRMVKIRFLTAGRETGVYNKQARGLFARFMAERRPMRADDLTEFDYDGYRHQGTTEDEMVFSRSAAVKATTKGSKAGGRGKKKEAPAEAEQQQQQQQKRKQPTKAQKKEAATAPAPAAGDARATKDGDGEDDTRGSSKRRRRGRAQEKG